MLHNTSRGRFLGLLVVHMKAREIKMAKPFIANSPERQALIHFIEGMTVPTNPTIHVNGKEHPSAVVVIDFGSTYEGAVRLRQEESAELANLLRDYTRDVLNRSAAIRVTTDTYDGLVMWSSLA